MSAPRHGTLFLAACALLAALVAPRALHAAASDYEQGVALLAAGRWDEARQALERSIASKPTSTAKRDGYFPYYQLGIAWQGNGSCRRALELWGEEERQGQIQKSPRIGDLRSRQQGCKQLLAQLDQLAARIAQGATELQPLVNQLEQRSASARAPEARALPAARNLAPAALRAELAGMSDKARMAAESEGRQKLQDLDARITALHRDIPATIQAIADADVVAAASAAEAARRAAAERAARQPAPAAAPAAPSAGLVQAVNAFLQGDAATALAALDALHTRSKLESAHACLLRAAALHQQALQQAGTREPVLDPARQALIGCRWREQGLTLSPKIFSPRFAVFAEAIR